jgi:hypothetical protein
MVWGSGIRDPGSGKNLFRIPDPGSRGQKAPNPGYGSATLIFPSWIRIQIVQILTQPDLDLHFTHSTYKSSLQLTKNWKNK